MRWLFIISAVFISSAANADIAVPFFFGDGMVLQRNAPVNIWGWVAAGEKVKIVFQNKTYNTVASQTGEWKIIVAAQKAGGPFQMIIQGKNQLLIKNILIGDVWIASGQSNMEYEMSNVKELYKKDIEFPEL